MGNVLPSATALMNTTDFCGEAQQYRDEQFAKLLNASSKRLNADGNLTQAGYAMLKVLEERTAQAKAKEASIRNGWAVDSRSFDESEKYAQVAQEIKDAETGMDRMINELVETAVPSVRIDIAVDEKTAHTLVGYTSTDISTIDAKLGQPIYPSLVNEALFVQQGLICRDGAYFQGETRTVLALDERGKPIIATQDQIDSGLAFLQDKLGKVGIDCQMVSHPYAEAKIEADKAQAAATQERAPAAPKTDQPERRPAPQTKPDDAGGGGVQPDMS